LITLEQYSWIENASLDQERDVSVILGTVSCQLRENNVVQVEPEESELGETLREDFLQTCPVVFGDPAGYRYILNAKLVLSCKFRLRACNGLDAL
jgi:hypothetical protein